MGQWEAATRVEPLGERVAATVEVEVEVEGRAVEVRAEEEMAAVAVRVAEQKGMVAAGRVAAAPSEEQRAQAAPRAGRDEKSKPPSSKGP